MSILQTFPQNLTGRDYAVGDIHGYFTQLKIGLDRVGFDPEKDRLFATGDLVDRGPESHLVLEWLEKPWFFSVQGNHESMAYRLMQEDYPCFSTDNEWIMDIAESDKPAYIAALQSLPIAIQVETAKGLIGIVHADLPTDFWDAELIERWNEEDIEFAQWSFARFTRQYKQPVAGVRALIHGHTCLSGHSVLGNVHFIDTKGGSPRHYDRLTLLDLATLKVKARL